MTRAALDPAEFDTAEDLADAFVGFARETCGLSRSHGRLMRRELLAALREAMRHTGASLGSLVVVLESEAWGHARWAVTVPEAAQRVLH